MAEPIPPAQRRLWRFEWSSDRRDAVHRSTGNRMRSLEDLLDEEGYTLVEDAWSEHGRRTYLHDDEEAAPGYLARLRKALRSFGWVPDRTALRTFRHETTGEIIEL